MSWNHDKYVVCLQASRINHSCTPNAYLDLNANINRVTVHAVESIPADREILISYCLPHYSRPIRTRDLSPYDFTCSCVVCLPSPLGAYKDYLRRHMEMLWLTLHIEHGDDLRHAVEDSSILEMIRLLTKEQLNVGALSVLYQRVASLAFEQGNRETALVYAGEKFKMEMYRLGADSPLTQETLRYITHLQSLPSIPPQPS